MTQQLLVKSPTAAWIVTRKSNQLRWTDAFDNDVWVKSDCTVTSGQTDPEGGTTAYTLTATANNAVVSQALLLTGGTLNRSFSIYVKRKTGVGAIYLSANGSVFEAIVDTAGWVRYDVSAVLGGYVTPSIKLAVSGDEVYISHAQFEDGLSPTDYATNGENRYTITQIVDADYPANTVRGCAFLDGRFFVMTPAGEIYQSALEDGFTWSALEFIQSQNDPSPGVFLSKIQNYIVAFKDWSTEFFYDAANPVGSILSPVQNAAMQIGCASDGSVQDVNGLLMFMGQTRAGHGRSIYLLQGTSPQKVSTPNVEKILNNDPLSEVYSWQAQVGAHQLYGVTLVASEVTLVFDMTSQIWSIFTYLVADDATATVDSISTTGIVTATSHGFSDGDIVKISDAGACNGWYIVTDVTTNTFQIQTSGSTATSGTIDRYVETYFPVVASVRANGRQYMQDKSSGALYEFDPRFFDAVGTTAARARTPKLDDQTANNKTMSQLEVIGDKIDSIAVVRWTDDDYVTYSNFRPVDLNAKRSRIRRLGDYNRRAFEILHVNNANIRVAAFDLT